MDYYHYILFWVCIIGACLGSFYNVVILRSLSNESIVFPPSKCPKCNHKLYAWHNIPIISYILLRGKCYFCKEKISIQYPIIELVTMLLFGLTYVKFGVSILTFFILLWISCFIIMTVTDLKEKLVDCNIAVIMGVSGLIYHFITNGWSGLAYSALGLILGVLILEIIARIGYLFVKSRAMGEADTYVAGAMGAIFGIQGITTALIISLLCSMIFIVPMYLQNQIKKGNKSNSIYMILFILIALVFKNICQTIWIFIPLLITGLLLINSILRGIKQKESINYLPYVPALALGTLYCLFFLV